MSDPIERVSGSCSSSGIRQMEIVKACLDIQNYTQNTTADTDSEEPRNGVSTAADVRKTEDKPVDNLNKNDIETSNEKPSSVITVQGQNEVTETSKEETLDRFEKIDEAIEAAYKKEISQDTDKDGIPDFLDASGNDTLIEQAYDEAAKRIGSEQVRAFVSILSMLNNFDLTNFDRSTVNGDPMSLSAIATAGCAQMALMHSRQLSNTTEIRAFNPENLKKLLQNQQEKTKAEKKAALKTAETLLGEIPTTKEELLKLCPQLNKLPPERQEIHLNRILKNLDAMKKSLITPASAEA
ncbi:MAG: hypothetical protein K2L24_02640 [Opitutales bacterium]|nr:hypothetical protein [Opitutales bacterium]